MNSVPWHDTKADAPSETTVADGGEILRSQVGSGVHGIAIEGTDDRDEMGVFIEPPEHVMGLSPPLGTLSWRTQPEGVRSGPGDLDLVRYSLRKYLYLATVKGNPTLLLPLYAPEDQLVVTSSLGAGLRALRLSIVSMRAVHRTLGYLDDQVQRMTEQRKVPNRPELVEKYGFDTKYASHAVRLAIQAYQLASLGTILLPMHPVSRDLVLDVKTGGKTQAEVMGIIEQHWHATEPYVEGRSHSPLPDEPDFEAVNQWSIYAHQQYWKDTQ